MAASQITEVSGPPLLMDHDTILQLFLAGLDLFGDQPAMLYRVGREWRGIPADEVAARVARIAAGLRALGVQPGERVAILSENRPEWAMVDFAVLALGCIDVPLYATLPPDQLAYILNDSGARTIFVSTPAQLEKITRIRNELPSLETLVVFDAPESSSPEADNPGEKGSGEEGRGNDPGKNGPENDAGPGGVISLAGLERKGLVRVNAGEFPGIRILAESIRPESVATLIYTSGTTGAPKGVELTHLNLASNVAAAAQHGVCDVGAGDTGLSFLPLSHAYERIIDYYYWSVGTTIAYVASVDAMADAMIEIRPHVLGAAPRIFEKIYAKVTSESGLKGRIVKWAQQVGDRTVEARVARKQTGPVGIRQKLADRLVFSKLRERTGGRVRYFISGSAPLSPEIARFFWAAGLRIFEGYGLTESSPILTANRPAASKLGSVGQPFPGTEIRLGPDGEILARGPQIMRGYFGKPEVTASTVDEDGWLHTGDVGRIDEDGFLWITDRIKNLIVTAGGKNIAPAPIENTAALSPFVSQVVMIGDRQRFPALLVVPELGYLRTRASAIGVTATDPVVLCADPRIVEMVERDILGRVSGFAHYEQPKKVLLIPKEFTVESGEITPTLKVKRRVVEEHYRDAISRMYQEKTGA
ncbi:MAG: long-chain fatty acid--CoA ligase [Gemmatimonadota bacterium]|jgi:long-chain acyl-CoA synthetase|nr:long-chain fatty acid--CoA ligase [Gemmatimonadota bacterium]